MRFATLASVSILAASALAAPATKRTCGVRPTTTRAPPPPETSQAPPPSQTSQVPPPPETSQPPAPPAAGGLTADQLIAIDGSSASCNGAPYANECATAEKAAPFIQASFDKYGITSVGEKAALIALIFFETGALKYDRNHFPEPGRPGQGTRNLMMFPETWAYATSLAETKDAALALAPSADSVDDKTKNAVRELVLGDELSFASAAWFLKTRCPADIASGLASESQSGWEAYITRCIYTTVTGDRQSSWQKALQVLKSA